MDIYHLESRQGADMTLTFDETDPAGLLRISAFGTMPFLSASETLSLLQWLYERRNTLFRAVNGWPEEQHGQVDVVC